MSMELTILGCNAALPTSQRNPSAQILTMSGRTFLIDCGEGTQFSIRAMHINFMRIDYIFISHSHGDHTFGLIGLLSTLSLLGRSTPLTIFCDPDFERMIKSQIEFYIDNMQFELIFRSLRFDKPEVILNTKGVIVQSIPLKHRVPTCGFIFREQPHEPNIKKEAIYKYGLTIADIVSIKGGRPFYDIDGSLIDRKDLVIEPPTPHSYAYISDTCFFPDIVPHISNVSLLYHEATFAEDCAPLAYKTLHSTAKQAATIANKANVGKLLIGHFSARYKTTDVLESEAQAVFENSTAVFDGFKIVF